MKKTVFLLLLFCTSFLELSAQKIYVGKASDFKHSLIDRINNIVYVYGDSQYKKIYLDSFITKSFPLKTEAGFNHESYTPLIVDSIPFFIHSKGGLVYEHRADSIVRIDNSFNHLMQCLSSIFSYNSKIHRFGGYGFWSARNFITFFDNKTTNEWEIINPENSTQLPEESIAPIHILNNNNLYVFNSFLNNPFNKYETLFSNKLWAYNFLEKKWTYLGVTEYIPNIDNQKTIIFENKLIIPKLSYFIIIDINENKINEFERGPFGFHISKTLESFFHNNRFYSFQMTNSGELFFYLSTKDEIIGKLISSKPFYTNNLKVKIWVSIVGVLIALFVLYKLIKSLYAKRNKIQITEKGLKYKQTFIPLNSEALAILKLLISSKHIKSEDILEIVQKEQFSRAHNERLKYNKIEEINFQLKTLLGTNEALITSKKSNYDRRIKVYSIQHKYFLKVLK